MDKADILKLDEASLHKRMSIILDKVKRIDEENPSEDTDPRIVMLLAEADLITQRLDPIMRERVRDDPAKLAEWDEIMHMCDDLDEADPEDSGTSQTP
jgi:hypothetical protein